MKCCEKCGVIVPSSRERCPLCQRVLVESDATGYDAEIFPYIPTMYRKHSLLIRVAIFLSVAVCVLCVAVNFLFWNDNWWSLFVLAGVGAAWAAAAQAIRRRSSFCKHILYQVVTVGLVVVLFDLMTGFHRWSFNYVILLMCTLTMLVIAAIAVTGHRMVSNYIIYMVLSAMFGIVPILFVLLHWTDVLWPTVFTAAASIIYLAGLLLFIGRDTVSELKKRLHL